MAGKRVKKGTKGARRGSVRKRGTAIRSNGEDLCLRMEKEQCTFFNCLFEIIYDNELRSLTANIMWG